VFMSLSQAG